MEKLFKKRIRQEGLDNQQIADFFKQNNYNKSSDIYYSYILDDWDKKDKIKFLKDYF